MLKLYKNIRERRLSLKMSQQELADMVGYKDRTSVAKVEAGEVDLSQSKINAFAKALGVSPIDLFGWNDSENPLDGIRNLSAPDAYAVPVLGRICCGDGTIAEESYDGYFVLDKSIRADFCLEARGSSMTDAGFCRMDYLRCISAAPKRRIQTGWYRSRWSSTSTSETPDQMSRWQ